MTQAQPGTIRIGGASAFWGDSSMGPVQLVQSGRIDYLVFDYLAELTMSIMAAQKLKNPEAGFALDFVAVTMKHLLKDIVARGIKVISNAGGVNPQACARALQAIAAEQGVSVRVAVIEGDDLMAQLPQLRTQQTLPDKLLSANAYLGALPVKAALDAGAQIVITGRCVDSAVTLGAMMHAFNWSASDYDRLAQGSLAGHIIECGCQATGGLFTDWQTVPDWAHMGYPVIECHPDGRFVVEKPPGTGGLITPATVAEQLVYEIGDPANYLLPDVNCDFTEVQMTALTPDRVEVKGATGKPPTPTYKVSSTYMDGFKSQATMVLIGFDAAGKARRTGEALLERLRGMYQRLGLEDFSATHIEVLGTESVFGPHAQTQGVREAIMRLVVRHRQKAALEIFTREIAAPGTSFAPGTTGMEGGRPTVSPLIKQHSFLVDKALITPVMTLDGARQDIVIPLGGQAELLPGADAPAQQIAQPDGKEKRVTVPLLRIAHGRSGDKGNISNIGLIARRPEALPWLLEQVTPQAVKAYLGHFVKGEVRRYFMPGIQGFNLVCEDALDGGGMASMRYDALGKGMAQILLSMPVSVPERLLK